MTNALSNDTVEGEYLPPFTIIYGAVTHTQWLCKIVRALNHLQFVRQFQTIVRRITLRKSNRRPAILPPVALPLCVILCRLAV